MKTYPLDKHLPGVSKLAYGCMGLGGGWGHNPISAADVTQAHQVVDVALDIGINFFDHADIYTLGKAEQVFGEVLKQRPELREHIYLQSKCAIRFDDALGPKRYDFSAQSIADSVDRILSRLQTEYIDILMLHRPDPLMEPEEVAEIFSALKQSGKVNHFAVSNMHQHQMAFLQSYLEQPIVANQIEISLQQNAWLDEGVTAGSPEGANVNFTPGTIEYCRQNNIQIQSWSSLCRGLYSGRDIGNESESVHATAQLVARLAAEYQVSKEAIVLAFLLRHPASIQPVIGSTNIERIKACQSSTSFRLTHAQWHALYVSARGHELP
jgi:predicted oxidoreductase